MAIMAVCTKLSQARVRHGLGGGNPQAQVT